MTRSRAAIEFQDVAAATFVVGLDLGQADFVSPAAALAALPAGGGHVYILNGTFTISTSITGTMKNVTIQGAGKANTVLSYTPGTGDTIAWGNAASPTGNACFCVKDLTISTGSTGACLNIIRLQDVLLVNVECISNSLGTGIKLSGCNSGVAVNCNARSNLVGIDFVTTGGDSANLFVFIGGQITNNTTAIRALGTSVANEFKDCNISANLASPAVQLEQAIGWTFRENFFESNFGGANTYTISLGTAPLPAEANLFDSNFFEEGNGVTYGIRLLRAVHTTLINNNVNSGLTGALCRVESQSANTFGFGNSTFNDFLPTLSDASSTNSTLWVDTTIAKYPQTVAYYPATPAQITSNQNNYALPKGRIVRMSTDISRTITGFSAGTAGEVRKIVNVGSANLVLSNLNGASLAANQILTGTGGDITLTPNATVNLWYDNTSAQWRVE